MTDEETKRLVSQLDSWIEQGLAQEAQQRRTLRITGRLNRILLHYRESSTCEQIWKRVCDEVLNGLEEDKKLSAEATIPILPTRPRPGARMRAS